MATKEQQQQLIDTLKFTPRTYTISMWGYGGEKVMGTVDPAAWDYCVANRVDLQDIAWGDDDTVEELGLDSEQLPFYPGQWYETDNMGHIHGVSRDAGTIRIDDENNNTVFEKPLEACDGASDSPQWSCSDEVWIGSRQPGEIVFVGSSNEKGTFFEGEIPLTAPFDIEKLELYYEEFDGEDIVNSVYYDGEEIDNNGGGTDGKSSDFVMVRLIDDAGKWERYEVSDEPVDPDDIIAEPTYQAEPAELVEFDFKQHKPVHKGWYFCNWRNGNTQSLMHWDGEEFSVLYDNELCPQIQTGILTWSGLNWNTGDWDNCPPRAEYEALWIPIKIKPNAPGRYECQFKKQPAWPWPPTQELAWDGKVWINDDGDTVTGVKEWRELEEETV